MANPRRPAAIEALVGDAVPRRPAADRRRAHRRSGLFSPRRRASDVPLHARIMNEEPFGPVAILKPFAATTSDRRGQPPALRPGRLRLHRRIRRQMISPARSVGMVGINTVIIGGADSPFGGVRERLRLGGRPRRAGRLPGHQGGARGLVNSPSPLRGEGYEALATKEPRRSWMRVKALKAGRRRSCPHPPAASRRAPPSPLKGEGSKYRGRGE